MAAILFGPYEILARRNYFSACSAEGDSVAAFQQSNAFMEAYAWALAGMSEVKKINRSRKPQRTFHYRRH